MDFQAREQKDPRLFRDSAGTQWGCLTAKELARRYPNGGYRIVADMKKKGISVSRLISRVARYRNSGEINFRVEDKSGAMDAVRDHFISCDKPTAMMDFDGYRVEFPDWWFNIRPSNTEPYLRFICEAVSDDLLAEKVNAVEALLSEKFGAVRA